MTLTKIVYVCAVVTLAYKYEPKQLSDDSQWTLYIRASQVP